MWEDIIKMGIKQYRMGVNWIFLAQDADKGRSVVISVLNIWFPCKAWSLLCGWMTVSSSCRSLML